MRERPRPFRIITGLLFSSSLSLALTLGACGDITSDREVARDRATTAVCDWYQGCGEIGPDPAQMMYPSHASCETQVRGNLESSWTVADCESKIKQDQLAICLDAIHIT